MNILSPILGLAAGLFAAAGALAAEPLKVIIPTAPGGGTDGYFRVLAREVEPHLGETVVVLVHIQG